MFDFELIEDKLGLENNNIIKFRYKTLVLKPSKQDKEYINSLTVKYDHKYKSIVLNDGTRIGITPVIDNYHVAYDAYKVKYIYKTIYNSENKEFIDICDSVIVNIDCIIYCNNFTRYDNFHEIIYPIIYKKIYEDLSLDNNFNYNCDYLELNDFVNNSYQINKIYPWFIEPLNKIYYYDLKNLLLTKYKNNMPNSINFKHSGCIISSNNIYNVIQQILSNKKFQNSLIIIPV